MLDSCTSVSWWLFVLTFAYLLHHTCDGIGNPAETYIKLFLFLLFFDTVIDVKYYRMFPCALCTMFLTKFTSQHMNQFFCIDLRFVLSPLAILITLVETSWFLLFLEDGIQQIHSPNADFFLRTIFPPQWQQCLWCEKVRWHSHVHVFYQSDV